METQQALNAQQKYLKIFSLFVLTAILLFPSNTTAQQLDWRYEYDTGEPTVPGHFWIDADGNGYFNTVKTNPNYPGQFDRSHSLLILNKDGKYNGSVYIKECGRGGHLLPFPNDKYILSGVNCTPDLEWDKQQSYLLNYNGKIIKEGKGFEGNYFSRQVSDNGFTYFSKPTGHFGHTFLSIGYVDEDFKISNDSIPLKPLKRAGLGMVFNYIDPVQLQNKSWILPFNYGKVKTGISVDHGSVFCVKDERILWQYPETTSDYRLKKVAGKNNTVTLYMERNSNASQKLFVQLGGDGNVIKSVSFQPKRWRFKELQVDEEHIIILTANEILWYDWEGDLVGTYDLTQNNISGSKMRLLPDGSIVVAGRNNNNCVYIKLSMEELDLPVPEEVVVNLAPEEVEVETVAEEEEAETEENAEEDILEVSYADASLESEYVFSASVFPNPTSLRINFELSGISDPSNSFLLEVFDGSGRRMLQDEFESNFYVLDVFDLIAGTYIYRISEKGTNGKKIISGRFIKVTN